MSDGENDRVREVDFVRVLVDGGRDNRGVDDDRVIGGHGFAAQLHAGVLRGEVDPDVFVQDEGDPDLTCRERKLGSVLQVGQQQKKNWACGDLLRLCGEQGFYKLTPVAPKTGFNLIVKAENLNIFGPMTDKGMKSTVCSMNNSLAYRYTDST